jgi:hypothetical protein
VTESKPKPLDARACGVALAEAMLMAVQASNELRNAELRVKELARNVDRATANVARAQRALDEAVEREFIAATDESDSER